MSKVKVVLAHTKRGVPCYAFTTKEQQEAYHKLTGQRTAPQSKLDALAAFGVKLTFIGEIPTTKDAVQEPSR